MPTLVVGMSRNGGKPGLMATQAWPWHPRYAKPQAAQVGVPGFFGIFPAGVSAYR